MSVNGGLDLLLFKVFRMVLPVIENKIYEIRDMKIMLDFDLSQLYEVETRVLNQAVRRNAERFPKDFMFQLAEDEWKDFSSSQFVMMKTLSRNRTGKYLPYAFTELGLQCSSVFLKAKLQFK